VSCVFFVAEGMVPTPVIRSMFTSMKAARRSLEALIHPRGRRMEFEVRPHDRRRGRLKNGIPGGGDLGVVRKCRAKTRSGGACSCPAMRNGRCRLHGGLSTGPKTPEGPHRDSPRVAQHARYTKQAEQEQLEWRELVRASREILYQLNSTN
jgi:hypothetical protein